MSEQPLKPVTFVHGKYNYHRQNTGQQILLLKALSITQDPKKLRQMIGVRTVAEVFRTFDKLAMRKEYHEALGKAGVTFDFIVSGLKGIATDGFKDSDKLNAYKTLLKSIGLDKYEDLPGSANTWEEELLKAIEKDKKENVPELGPGDDYEVVAPIVPPDVVTNRKKENEDSKKLYG